METVSTRQLLSGCVLGAALSVCPTTLDAAASLIGDEVAIGYFFPTFESLLGSGTVIVNDGYEAICPGASFACDILLSNYGIDIGENTIAFRQTGTTLPYNPGEVNGWLFTDLDFGRGIGGVSLRSTGLPGLTASDVFFNADSVFVSLLNVTSSVGFDNGFEVELIELPEPEPIPLPSTLALLAGALAGVGATRRRSRHTAG